MSKSESTSRRKAQRIVAVDSAAQLRTMLSERAGDSEISETTRQLSIAFRELGIAPQTTLLTVKQILAECGIERSISNTDDGLYDRVVRWTIQSYYSPPTSNGGEPSDP